MSSQLDEILNRIQKNILAGAFDGLADLAAALNEEISKLGIQDRDELLRLQAKSRNIENCTLAAMHGLAAAKLRIKEIRKAASGLTTYGQDGRPATLTSLSRPAKRV